MRNYRNILKSRTDRLRYYEKREYDQMMKESRRER